MKKVMWVFLLILLTVSVGTVRASYGLSITFSDKDFLNGASWGTMTISVVDANTLGVKYEASTSPTIPAGSQATGFGFTFVPSSVVPDSIDNFSDVDSLIWVKLTNLNSIPNPANGDEFSPPVTKSDFFFGATERQAGSINPPGIRPGQFDSFNLNFTGVDFSAQSFSLNDFVKLTGVRLQSLPNSINGGSLFLVGDGTPIPEPSSLLLLGSGLLGLVAFGVKRKAKK